MNRSKGWLIIICFVLVFGLTVTHGIIVTTSSKIDNKISLEEINNRKWYNPDRVFQYNPTHVSSISIIDNLRQEEIELTKLLDTPLHWQLKNPIILNVDQDIIDNFANSIILMVFKEKIIKNDNKFEEYGLINAEYTIKLHSIDGEMAYCLIGEDIDGNDLRYLYSMDKEELGIVSLNYILSKSTDDLKPKQVMDLDYNKIKKFEYTDHERGLFISAEADQIGGNNDIVHWKINKAVQMIDYTDPEKIKKTIDQILTSDYKTLSENLVPLPESNPFFVEPSWVRDVITEITYIHVDKYIGNDPYTRTITVLGAPDYTITLSDGDKTETLFIRVIKESANNYGRYADGDRVNVLSTYLKTVVRVDNVILKILSQEFELSE